MGRANKEGQTRKLMVDADARAHTGRRRLQGRRKKTTLLMMMMMIAVSPLVVWSFWPAHELAPLRCADPIGLNEVLPAPR